MIGTVQFCSPNPQRLKIERANVSFTQKNSMITWSLEEWALSHSARVHDEDPGNPEDSSYIFRPVSIIKDVMNNVADLRLLTSNPDPSCQVIKDPHLDPSCQVITDPDLNFQLFRIRILLLYFLWNFCKDFVLKAEMYRIKIIWKNWIF